MAGFVVAKNERTGNESLNITDKVFPVTQITVLDETGTEIGYIREINPTKDRPVEPVRHLNADDAGRILQGVPRPETPTLSVSGFSIYKEAIDTEGTVLSRLVKNSGNPSAIMKSLEEQKVPFMVKAKVVNPNGENSITVYHGCWITRHNNPMSIDNAFVTETADLFVSFIDEV